MEPDRTGTILLTFEIDPIHPDPRPQSKENSSVYLFLAF